MLVITAFLVSSNCLQIYICLLVITLLFLEEFTKLRKTLYRVRYTVISELKKKYVFYKIRTSNVFIFMHFKSSVTISIFVANTIN